MSKAGSQSSALITHDSALFSMHPSLLSDPILLSQLAFQNFPGAALGQRPHIKIHRARHLEVCNAAPAMLDDLVSGGLHTGLEYNDGFDGLPPRGVGHAHDRRLKNSRMRVEDIFHFGREDVLAAGDD